MTFFERYQSEITVKQRRSNRGNSNDEFERFISGPRDNLAIPPLDWWQQDTQMRSYPQLSKMAIDILSCQAMSAEDERIFSGARRLIPWTRASLSSRVIEQLECIKH